MHNEEVMSVHQSICFISETTQWTLMKVGTQSTLKVVKWWMWFWSISVQCYLNFMWSSSQTLCFL